MHGLLSGSGTLHAQIQLEVVWQDWPLVKWLSMNCIVKTYSKLIQNMSKNTCMLTAWHEFWQVKWQIFSNDD